VPPDHRALDRGVGVGVHDLVAEPGYDAWCIHHMSGDACVVQGAAELSNPANASDNCCIHPVATCRRTESEYVKKDHSNMVMGPSLRGNLKLLELFIESFHFTLLLQWCEWFVIFPISYIALYIRKHKQIRCFLSIIIRSSKWKSYVYRFWHTTHVESSSDGRIKVSGSRMHCCGVMTPYQTTH
jgi:hypothetical protein